MTLTLATAGQILIHRPLAAAPGAVRDALQADGAFSNFEATVETPGAWPTKTKTLHLASPDALAAVRDLGFAAVTHANNHAFDLGPPGVAATRAAAAAASLGLAGSGTTLAEALAPVRLGPIALFGVDCGPQPDIVYAGLDRAGIAPLRLRRSVAVPAGDYEHLAALVQTLGDDRRAAARASVGYQAPGEAGGFDLFGTPIQRGDAVAAVWAPDPDHWAAVTSALAGAGDAALRVVCLHNHNWDPDWRRMPGFVQRLAENLIDAGADLVVGHGAPVLQGIAFHRGKPILGGLGNLVFHTQRPATYDRQGTDVWRSAIVRATFAADRTCTALDVLPVAVGRPEPGLDERPAAPVPLRGEDAEAMVARVTAGLTPDERALVRRL